MPVDSKNRNLETKIERNETFYNEKIVEFLRYNGFEEVADVFEKEVECFTKSLREDSQEQNNNDSSLVNLKAKFLQNITDGVPFDILSLKEYDFELLLNENLLNYIKRLFILEIIEKEKWKTAFFILDDKYPFQTINYEKQNEESNTTSEETNTPSHLDYLEKYPLSDVKLTIQVNDLLQHIIYKTKPDISKERELTAELINQLIMVKQGKECALLEAVSRVGPEILIEKIKLSKTKLE